MYEFPFKFSVIPQNYICFSMIGAIERDVNLWIQCGFSDFVSTSRHHVHLDAFILCFLWICPHLNLKPSSKSFLLEGWWRSAKKVVFGNYYKEFSRAFVSVNNGLQRLAQPLSPISAETNDQGQSWGFISVFFLHHTAPSICERHSE